MKEYDFWEKWGVLIVDGAIIGVFVLGLAAFTGYIINYMSG